MINNEVLEILKTRRSCRSFTDELVDDETINAIVQAGSYAASAQGKQPSRVVVVNNPDLMKTLSQMNAEFARPGVDPFYGAKQAIIVFTNAETSPKNWRQDGALVMANLMNAAASLGIGTCWINRAYEMFDTPKGIELKKSWGLDEHDNGVAICIIGHPKDKATGEGKPRRKDFMITIS